LRYALLAYSNIDAREQRPEARQRRIDAQVGLTLRTLGGLSTEEIARAFLVPFETMSKRLTRARPPASSAASSSCSTIRTARSGTSTTSTKAANCSNAPSPSAGFGREDEARTAYTRALELTQPGPEQRFLESRLAGLSRSAGQPYDP